MMRLLKVDEAGGFSLVKFQSGQIPKYAILSHTWGHEDDEMTFQDMVSGSGQDKQGYRKLEFCAAQARRDQLDYFWIDTCCIDKTNSVELNTAINSMFNWYERAARCYAFLADAVVWAGPGHDWQFDLRNSEWFRRGWTLQELLAPKSVEFYSPDHARLGDKLSLALEIGEITGIPVDALQGHLPLSSFTVQERFAWIKNRETTREEDKVYSLVGIFDVSLVPCYGEGLKKASRRLRRAIKAASEEDDELDDFWGSAATRPPFVATGLAQQEHRGGRPTMNLRSKREPRSNGEAQRMTGDGTGTVGYSDSPRRESRDWPTTGLSFRWWIPADGIKEDVIYADIQRYLGPDARVIAGEGRDNDQVSALVTSNERGLAKTHQGSSWLLDSSLPSVDSKHGPGLTRSQLEA